MSQFTNSYILLQRFGVGLGVFNSLMTEIEELVQTANYDSDDAGIFGAVLIGCGFLSCGIVG